MGGLSGLFRRWEQHRSWNFGEFDAFEGCEASGGFEGLVALL